MQSNFSEHVIQRWVNDWTLFAEEAMQVVLDDEQKEILRSVQRNPMTSVCSGTSRGKDFIAAVAAMCFLYLMPSMHESGQLESTKVALTAPTERQVKDIMMPEIALIYHRLKKSGICPNNARLLSSEIRTNNENVFLTGFKSDESNHEAWSGFHAINTMFIVTEATGISESVHHAIEGNLQNNSRLLLVFNDNTGSGYAASSQRSPRFKSFRLDSLNAPNVKLKKVIIPGQVNYEWVLDKVNTWCIKIHPDEFREEEGDFVFDVAGVQGTYRPNDLFRVKVRGMAPKVSEDVLIPMPWIEAANRRWREYISQGWKRTKPLRLGVDVAGMGRDSSCFCFRLGDYVEKFRLIQSSGTANHMEVVGLIVAEIKADKQRGFSPLAFIDTIGEGAGTISRLQEQGFKEAHSCKFSEAAAYNGVALKDYTKQYEFLNMRAYLYWAIRDWLNPANKSNAALPPDAELAQELCGTRWRFRSDGRIQIEEKEEIKKRLKRSPDKSDALANTFFPVPSFDIEENARRRERLKQFANSFQ